MRSGLVNAGTTFVLVLYVASLAPLVGAPPAWCEDAKAAVENAFIITTDYYTTAYYSTIEIPPPRTAMVSIEPVSPDAVAYYDDIEDIVFVVNRYEADNIQIVDTDPLFTTIGQYSVGNRSNPHDIRLVDNTKAYVSRYEWKTLLIVHPYLGDSLGVIDLSPIADADGIPEMDRMEIVGEHLFVTLNSIDRLTWLPDGPGKIAVIDVEADTLVDCNPDSAGVQPIVLSLPNPYSELRYDPCRQELYVGCLGAWGVMDGGVEVIDPFALESKGVLITEEDLGGDVSDVVRRPGSGFYVVVLDDAPWPNNFARLVRVDELTGTVADTLFQQTSGSGSALAGIEVNRQLELYLCDRDLTHPGIRIFDIETDTEIAFIDVGLPPFDVAFTQTPFVSVDDRYAGPEGKASLTALSHPNPFNLRTTITCTLSGEAAGPIRLEIFDATGRLVRTLLGPMTAGTWSAEWNGTDDLGRPIAPGLYVCRAEHGGQALTRKLLFIR